MLDHHPPRDTLDRFMLGELTGSDARSVVRHLLGGCCACQAVTLGLWRSAGHFGPTIAADRIDPHSSYGPVFDRVFREALLAAGRSREEKAGADRLIARLLKHPVDRQLLLVRNSAAYVTWGLCERLLDEGFELRFSDPHRMRELCRVAVEIALQLDPSRYGDLAVADLRGRAWTSFGNAHRIVSDFVACEEALREAAAHLAAGSGSPQDRAWLCNVEAVLRFVQNRVEESEPLVDRAIALYRRAGDLHAAGRVLITKGSIRHKFGDFEGQIALVREGLELIDPARDPRVVVSAWHNLVRALHELGRNDEALALLARARPLYLRFPDRTSLIHFQWLEGNLCAAVGRCEQAEGNLREARRAWAELEMVHEVALATLDLAELLSGQGRHAEVRELAAELIAIARSRDIHAEALAAMLVFQRAAEKERVSAVVVKRVAEALERVPARSRSWSAD